MENNKEDIFYTIVEKAKEAKLTERERTSLFMAVDGFVKRNPIQAKTVAPTKKQAPVLPIKSPFFSQDWFYAFSLRSHNYYIATALVVLAIFGTGTSFAAHGSLPGDVLYPMKVNVLEEIKSVFLPSSLKSEYEINRAQTRIAEAKKLAEQDKLSPEIKIAVAAQIDTHITTVKKDISELEEKGDLKHVLAISNSLESALNESEYEIESLDENNEHDVQIAFVKEIIQDKKESVLKNREIIEDKIFTLQTNDSDTQEIAQAKFESTENAILSIEKRLALAPGSTMEGVARSKSLPIADETVTTMMAADEPGTSTALMTMSASLGVEVAEPSLEELVAQVKDLLAQGEEKMKAQEYNEAFRIFREANYVTQIIDFRMGVSEDIGRDLDVLLDEVEPSASDEVLQIDSVEEKLEVEI